jgi:hypothetical protein
MDRLVLDAHTHCGYTVPFEELSWEWRNGAIDGGVVFSPVEEIYDRYDPWFTDSHQYKRSRSSVHAYLLDLGRDDRVYPYFFVWNDFAAVPKGFVGIKWHRHPGEPVYAYETPRCEALIEEICFRKLPIVLEEEYGNTLEFVRRINERTVVIIPHMGGLNGGYARLKAAGLFESTAVWADTALAGSREIEDFARSFGTDRLLFGSDYPFGVPSHEKQKVVELFSQEELTAVLSGNLLHLLGDVR